jgi:general stress protein 26
MSIFGRSDRRWGERSDPQPKEPMMSEPATDLDPRYSTDGVNPTDWSHTQSVLETAQLFWITTVREDGRPHVVPLVAVWLDGMLHFSSGQQEQKISNLRHHDQVTLLTGSDRWYAGLDVTVEGRAERVTDPVRLERIATAWQTKWNGYWQHSVIEGGFGDPGGRLDHVYAVRPTKIFAFGRGPAGFSQTRYRPADQAARP